MLNQHNLYTMTPDEKQEQWYREAGDTVARLAASEAAAMGPGECPQALAEQLYGFPDFRNREYYYVEVYHSDELVHTISKPLPEGVTYEYRFKPRYPKVVNIHTSRPDLPLPGTEPVRSEVEEVWVDSQKLYYELYYYDDGPTYTVMVTMTPEALRDTFYSNLATLYPYRHTLIWAAVVSLLLAISATVYLIWAAGRAKDGSVHLGGLNRMPLDLYLLLVGLVGYIPLMIAIALYAHNNSLTYFTATLLVLFGTIVSMLILALIYALAAQIKRGGGYWWRHTIIGACAVKAVKGISELLKMINVVWKWLLASIFCLALTVFLCVTTALNFQNLYPWLLALLILCCVSCLALIAYAGYCFAVLLSGVKRMSQGELEHKIPMEHLRGDFRVCAQRMNALSDTANEAVHNQVRAERMKTELITNVSHDIKTPLTSIINYVDLLGKSHNREDEQQYLEVLSRQSLQLKKLIEDLIELSKASSGNMTANITTLDVTESVNQALGEFSDKLARVKLTPVFKEPEQPMMIAADGRLTWRVLSNLLGNAVKYATPGTRVFVELEKKEDKVLLSIKNVSREELRFSAEELLERFVRGDASRNREGSGLGLNIAKSLMEVQHGSLRLTLDGDLFKVTLTFPTTTPPMENI